jgi:hypothetical protein
MFVLDKLKRRPNPSTQKSFDIRIKNNLPEPENQSEENMNEEVTKSVKPEVKYVDYREHSTIDRADVLKRIKDRDFSYVKRAMPTSKMTVEPEKTVTEEDETENYPEAPSEEPETVNEEPEAPSEEPEAPSKKPEPIIIKRKIKKGVEPPAEPPVSTENLGEIIIKKPQTKKPHIATIAKMGSKTLLSAITQIR